MSLIARLYYATVCSCLLTRNFFNLSKAAIMFAIALLLSMCKYSLSEGPPQIQPFFFPKHITMGQKTSAMCTAIAGLPPYSFNWLKDGKEIHEYSPQISVESMRDFSAILIDPVDVSTSGNYTCILSTSSGSASHSAYLEVKVPPQWIYEPSDVEALLGTNVTINCEASGFPTPTVVWKKLLSDSTSGHYVQTQKQASGKSILILEKVTNEESGYYICYISNDVGNDVSRRINIKVIDLPKIQPFSFPEHPSSGDKVTVFCAVRSGEPPFTFTWLKDGQEIKTNTNTDSGNTQEFSNLVINPVTMESIGNYTCVVKNQYGTDRYTDSLAVEVPPVWLATPEDSTVILGGDITLLCAANGYPYPTILWRKTGDRLSKDSYHHPIETERGNLVLTDVKDEDESHYMCEAKNGIGEGLRRVIYIAVNVPPKIQSFNFPTDLTVGQTAKAICSIKEGSGPFTFYWLKDGKEITSTPETTFQTFGDYSVLIMEKLIPASIGNYTCRVTSPAGSDQLTASLRVNAPPVWKSEPEDAIVEEGSSVSIFCDVEGYPAPSIAWKRDSPVFSISSNSTFHIQNADKNSEGYYTCVASNGVGEDLVKTIFVKILVPARFEEKFTVQNVRRGDSAVLKCDAIGDKPMSVTWSKDKRVMDFTKLTRLEKFDREQEKGINSELVIRTADRNDGALYTCFAKNEYGNDERNVKLQVVEVPAQPLDVKVQEVWSRRATIKWSSPYSGNSAITKYIVQYWRDRGGAHRLLEETVPNSQTSVQLESLHPGTPYSVTVVAENEIGQGEPSDIFRFVTGEEEPSSPPTDVWIQPKGSSSIVVSWKPPPREYWNGELKGYNIGYKIDSFSHSYAFKTVDNTKNDTHEYTLTNLMKSSKYSVVVKAFNSAGAGPASQELVAKTLDGDLPKPPQLSLHGISDSAISLRWGESPSKNIPVTGYTVHYKKDSGEWYHIPIIATAHRRFTVTGLDRGTNYDVYITASNQFGNGEPGEMLQIKTSTLGFGGGIPFYLDLSIIIPVATCLLAFLVIIIVIAVYIRKSKARRNIEKALQDAKPHTYSGTSQRYIDINKARPTNEMGAPGLSYATMPPRDESLGPQNMKERPLPYPKPVSLPKKGNSRFYDTAE